MAPDLRAITEIRGMRGSPKRTIFLDGEMWRSAHRRAVQEIGLAVGTSIDVDEVAASFAQIEPGLCRERAYRLLGFRDRSPHELASRLAGEGFPSSLVESLVAELTNTGILDPRRFAQSRASALVTGRGFGRTRALAELARAGIPDDLATDVIDEVMSQEDEPAHAGVMADRLYRSGDTPERLAARLIRRGFSTHDALHAARSRCSEPS